MYCLKVTKCNASLFRVKNPAVGKIFYSRREVEQFIKE